MFKFIAAAFLIVFPFHTSSQQTTPANNKVFDPSKSDAKALAVMEEMWTALGGKDNWEKARYLGFRWLVEREGNVVADFRHDWDRYTNRYRVEGTDRDGKHFVVLFNTDTKDGEVYLDGVRLPADTTKTKMLEDAYGRHINDSYWLIMPYKLNDPGVILNYEGEKEAGGQQYDVIKVTFENVGLTPKDTYWAFISKNDRLMHKWEYVLQDRQPPPTICWWKDWQTIGGIKLAMNKEFEGRPVRIYFKEVKVSPTVDEAVFEMTGKTF